MLAIFRIIKASPGWKFRICEGQTRESEHANTINCIDTKIYKMLNWTHSQAKLIRKNKMYFGFESFDPLLWLLITTLSNGQMQVWNKQNPKRTTKDYNFFKHYQHLKKKRAIIIVPFYSQGNNYVH